MPAALFLAAFLSAELQAVIVAGSPARPAEDARVEIAGVCDGTPVA